MLGAVKEHKKMFEAGLFHRDVSAGNILIRPASPSRNRDLRTLVSTTSGALIDLDHAKYTTASSKLGQSVLSPDLVRVFTQTAKLTGHNIREDVVVQSLKLLSDSDDMLKYIRQATKRNVRDSNPNGLWSAKDLGWKDVGQRPNFALHRPTVNERTGTLPFISYQLIVPDEDIIHEAIHDLESFWWIIIYLCLTRESGGGCKRKDFAEELRNLVTSLFEANEKMIAFDKSTCFKTTTDRPLETLLRQFHTYFDPLKPMLRRWRNVLILGYTFKAHEYYHVHDYVIEIIKDALHGLPDDTSNIEVVEKELQRREEDYARVCNIPPSTVPPVPYGSPPSSPISVASGGISPPRPQRHYYGPPRPPASSTSGQEPSTQRGQFQMSPQSPPSYGKPPSKKPRQT